MPHTVETEALVRLVPETPATASVIWLHGLGADGHDFVPIVPELRLPASLAVRFTFPHAPVRPVTLNNGYPMRAWYDIKSLTAAGRGDEAGTVQSIATLHALVREELALGIPAHRIAIAGFSQGGAVALHAGLSYPERLAGVLALSTYLPLDARIARDEYRANVAVPVFMAHGTHDPVVQLSMGLAARDALTRAGWAVQWREYPMQHEVCMEEIADVARVLGGWLR